MSGTHPTGAHIVPLVARVGYGSHAVGTIPTGEVEVIRAACFAWAALELARPDVTLADVARGWTVPAALEVDAFPTAGGCVALVAPGDARALLERFAAAGIRASVVDA